MAPHASLALPRGTVNSAASNIAQTSRRWLFPPPLHYPSFGGRRLEAACSPPSDGSPIALSLRAAGIRSEEWRGSGPSNAGTIASVQIRKSSFLALLPLVAAAIQAACARGQSSILGSLFGSRYFGRHASLALAALAEQSVETTGFAFEPSLALCLLQQLQDGKQRWNTERHAGAPVWPRSGRSAPLISSRLLLLLRRLR